MQAVRSQIVRMMTESESGSPPSYQHLRVDDDRMSLGYYFVMPKARTKQGRKTIAGGALCVFGPFHNPDVARFINTSARALGLLAHEAANSPGALPEPSPARPVERKTRRSPAPIAYAGAAMSGFHLHSAVAF